MGSRTDRSRWRVARLIAAVAILVACSDEMNLAGPAEESQQQAEVAGKAVLAESHLSSLGSLGYVDREGVRASDASSAVPIPYNARNDDALSELDRKNEQNLAQRAKEAFDYLARGRQRAEPKQKPGRTAAAFDAVVGGGLGPNLSRSEEAEYRAQLESRARGLATASGFVFNNGGKLHRAFALSSDERDADEASGSPAQLFLRERRQLDGLTFQQATGYWANTYVPGDPVMRWLESRLERHDKAALQRFAARPILLDGGARPTLQPFDPPSSAAISVFLQADQRAITGKQRILIQVGLRGAERNARLRPAMSVGIVLDLRGSLSSESAASMRALLDAFLTAKDVGDRFSVTVAGRPGAVVVAADDFRHGPLSVVMSRLLGADGSPSSQAPTLSLEQSVAQTLSELGRSEDPAAPLGSRMLLLVTSQPLGFHAQALEAIAHDSAVGGIPLSVIGVGAGVEPEEIERITLAGQGNLRLLYAPAEAERLVEEELAALSRVIARALRLRIRLAAGVELIEVIGADRLDADGADRVRQAERSIDRRLAHRLGIESDRGEDEAGIQIVIPTFYGGDSHAVLLDVVVSGPGPVADVSVRYKDLVYLRNSVAQANLTLSNGSRNVGPLQRNVVKNYLAIRLSETLKQAGRALLEGGDANAIASIREFQALLESLQREVPGFQNDVDLASDAGMLAEYLALMDGPALAQEVPRVYLADSLQLSGYFKTVPRTPAVLRLSRRS